MKQEIKDYVKYLFVEKYMTNIYGIVACIYIKKLETEEQWGKLYAMVFKETQRLNSELKIKK